MLALNLGLEHSHQRLMSQTPSSVMMASHSINAFLVSSFSVEITAFNRVDGDTP